MKFAKHYRFGIKWSIGTYYATDCYTKGNEICSDFVIERHPSWLDLKKSHLKRRKSLEGNISKWINYPMSNAKPEKDSLIRKMKKLMNTQYYKRVKI